MRFSHTLGPEGTPAQDAGSMVRIDHFVCSFSARSAEKLHTTNT
jgi:hypothetical protein